MTSLTKNLKPKKFFLLQTQRLAESFEGLNNSLTQSVAELCPCKDTCKLIVLHSNYTGFKGVKKFRRKLMFLVCKENWTYRQGWHILTFQYTVAIGKAWAACLQSFALWQQATIEFTCHDHSIACSRHVYILLFFTHIPFVVNHTFNATGEVATILHKNYW